MAPACKSPKGKNSLPFLSYKLYKFYFILYYRVNWVFFALIWIIIYFILGWEKQQFEELSCYHKPRIMSDEEVGETLGQLRISKKLLEATSEGFRDRSKRRLSLPLSNISRDTRKSSIASQASSGIWLAYIVRWVSWGDHSQKTKYVQKYQWGHKILNIFTMILVIYNSSFPTLGYRS